MNSLTGMNKGFEMKSFALAAGICISILCVDISLADSREDFAKCIDSYLEVSKRNKPTLAEFTVSLDKLCTSEAMNKEIDKDFPSAVNQPADSPAGALTRKLRKNNDDYAAEAKGLAVSYYSKLQVIWRKTGM